jgi:hypothetical protein
LLDWGVRVYPALGDAETTMVSKRLIALLKLFAPSIIVIKKERWDKAATNTNMGVVVDIVKQEAFSHAIPILSVTDDNVRRTFLNFRCDTRDEIAAALARIFPVQAAAQIRGGPSE